MKSKARGRQNCGRSRTTLTNHKREWYVRACAQARDCRRSVQRCRLTLNFDTCDLARDIHGVNCELATAISSWRGRDESQTLEVSGHRLTLAFGMESDGRDDRDKTSRQPRPALNESLAAAASENLGSLCGLSVDGSHRNGHGNNGQEQYAIDSDQAFKRCLHNLPL